MRRDSLKLTLTRITLAYLVALQTLLGSFGGSAVAGNSLVLDPSVALCRAAGGDMQPLDQGDGAKPHCAVMCLSGGCAAGGSTPAVSASVEFPVSLVVSVSPAGDRLSPVTLTCGLYARGPPLIG